MRNQNIEIPKGVFAWYAENFQSARQTMGRTVESVQYHLTDHPVAALFDDPVSGMEFMVQAWKNIYRHSIASLKGIFSRGELALFIDTHNGTMLSPWHYGSNTLAAGTSDSIALDFTADKWDVDSQAIIEKIHTLTPTQALCLELWAVGFWRQGAGFESYIDQLT